MKQATLQKHQSGVALFICLILLLIMTLLAISSMGTSILEEKMAGNYKNTNQAFQSAETSLRNSEEWLAAQTSEPIPNNTGSNEVWTLNSPDPDSTNNLDWWNELSSTWWGANARSYGVGLTSINTPPSSLIEYKTFVSDSLLMGTGSTSTGLTIYQITARGTGGSDQAKVFLQSTVARRY